MKRHAPALLFLLLLAGLLLAASQAGATGNGLAALLNTFDLSWWTVDGGGHTAVSGNCDFQFSLAGGG